MPIIKHKRKQTGGVKLVDVSKQGFAPVHDMLMSPSANLEHFTSSSLKGFMIKLQVDPQHSEYASQSSGGTGRFSGRETSFILKFVVLAPQNDTRLMQFNGRKKASESHKSFYDEAVLQRDIWARSIQGGRKQICPSVANLSMFDNTSSLHLLDDLLVVPQDPDTTAAFNYLKAEIRRHTQYGMGILTMPNIVGSVTFGRYNIDTNGFDKRVYSLAIARTVRLFIDIGVVHLDLHEGNILIFENKRGDLDCVIIDFGRACDVKKGGCTMLNRKEIDAYHALGKRLYDRRYRYDEAVFMEHVIKELVALDYKVNQRTFNIKKGQYQMMWKEDVSEKDKHEVYREAYDLLGIDIVDTIGHGKEYMDKLMEENPITRMLTPYVSSSPPQSAQSASPPQSAASSVSSQSNSSPLRQASSSPDNSPPCKDEGGCAISGGTKRRKVQRKHTKSKKYRKK